MKPFSSICTMVNRENVLLLKRFIATVNSTTKNLNIQYMPRAKGLPVIGTKLDFLFSGSGSNLHEYVDKRHKQLGSIFCEEFGKSDIVFINNPEVMKTLFLKLEGRYPAHILPDPWLLYEELYGSRRGLFFMNGEEWLKNRRKMNKFLLREDPVNLLETPIKEVIEIFISSWKINAKDGSKYVPNLEAEFYRLSIDVIVAILIGTDKKRMSNHYDDLLDIFAKEVKKIFQTTTALLSYPLELCYNLNLKPWRDFKESVDISLNLAQKIVHEMMSMNNLSSGLLLKLKEEYIPEKDITRIVGDLIIAAGDTTSYTLLWTLYLLSNNPEVIKEIREKDISFAKNVLKESMRLYPVAPFLTRILPNDAILGSYKLEKGTPIVASIYSSSRDEQYFSKPLDFLPYRWDRQDARRIGLVHESSASMPFALGARSCIGKKIALIQLSEFIKQVADNFDFKCSNSARVNAVTSQVLVPDKAINLEFTLRKN